MAIKYRCCFPCVVAVVELQNSDEAKHCWQKKGENTKCKSIFFLHLSILMDGVVAFEASVMDTFYGQHLYQRMTPHARRVHLNCGDCRNVYTLVVCTSCDTTRER